VVEQMDNASCGRWPLLSRTAMPPRPGEDQEVRKWIK
jgi:hypothetical protein